MIKKNYRLWLWIFSLFLCMSLDLIRERGLVTAEKLTSSMMVATGDEDAKQSTDDDWCSLDDKQKDVDSPELSYVKRINIKSAKIKWKKVSGASGYEVYMSTKPKSGFKKVKTTKEREFTKRKLDGKEIYYFKIRTYIKSGNKKVYSTYSEPLAAEVLTVQKIKNRILAFEANFPDGRYWNHVGKKIAIGADTSNYVTKKPCKHSGYDIASTCNMYYCEANNTQGYQCWGFADMLCDTVFGKDSKIQTYRSFSKARVGDHVRYQNHSAVIIEKRNNFVNVVEVNYGNTCLIKWGRRISKAELKGAYYYSRY